MFSSKDFTVHTDRLPALAGLAFQIAGVVKDDQYLAGLWRKNLAQDLLWSLEERDRRIPFQERINSLSDPLSTTRPSWSWAGIAGRCWPGAHPKSTRDVKLTCKVLAFGAGAEDGGPQPNNFSRRKNAHVRLRCSMSPLVNFHGDARDARAASKRTLNVNEDQALGLRRILWDTDNRGMAESVAAKIQLVYISASQSQWEAFGLFVCPVDDDSNCRTYFRVGVGKTSRGGGSLLGLTVPGKWVGRTIMLI